MNELSRRPFLVIACIACFYLLPLWAARYPIMQDLPAHVEIGCQILRIWRDDPMFTSALLVHPQPWANSLPSVLLAGLLAIMPSFTVAKVALSFYVVAWPLSVAFLLRSYGRSPWLALLCLPTTLDFTWAFGFFNFLLAKPLFCLTLVSARSVALRGGARRGLGLAGLLTLLFVSHSLIWLLALGGAGLVLLLRAEPRWKAIPRAWPLLLAVSASIPFFSHTFSSPSRRPWAFRAPLDTLKAAWTDLGSINASHGDEIAWSVALLALIFAVVTSGVTAPRERGRDRTALALISLTFFAGYLLGPTELPQVEIVAQRLLVFAVVLLCACAPSPRRRFIPILVGSMTFAAVIHAGDAARMYRAFSSIEMGDFDQLLRQAPPRGRLATYYQSTHSPYGRENAMWHWPKLYCLTGGGFTDDTFAYRHTAYVEVRKEARAAGFVTPFHRMQPAALARFNALIIRGGVNAERQAKDTLSLIGTTGTWRLAAIRAKTPDQ